MGPLRKGPCRPPEATAQDQLLLERREDWQAPRRSPQEVFAPATSPHLFPFELRAPMDRVRRKESPQAGQTSFLLSCRDDAVRCGSHHFHPRCRRPLCLNFLVILTAWTQNFTFGRARSPSSASKNSCFQKPNDPATRFVGMVSIFVLSTNTFVL